MSSLGASLAIFRTGRLRWHLFNAFGTAVLFAVVGPTLREAVGGPRYDDLIVQYGPEALLIFFSIGAGALLSAIVAEVNLCPFALLLPGAYKRLTRPVWITALSLALVGALGYVAWGERFGGVSAYVFQLLWFAFGVAAFEQVGSPRANAIVQLAAMGLSFLLPETVWVFSELAWIAVPVGLATAAVFFWPLVSLSVWRRKALLPSGALGVVMGRTYLSSADGQLRKASPWRLDRVRATARDWGRVVRFESHGGGAAGGRWASFELLDVLALFGLLVAMGFVFIEGMYKEETARGGVLFLYRAIQGPLEGDHRFTFGQSLYLTLLMSSMAASRALVTSIDLPKGVFRPVSRRLRAKLIWRMSLLQNTAFVGTALLVLLGTGAVLRFFLGSEQAFQLFPHSVRGLIVIWILTPALHYASLSRGVRPVTVGKVDFTPKILLYAGILAPVAIGGSFLWSQVDGSKPLAMSFALALLLFAGIQWVWARYLERLLATVDLA